MRSVSTPGADCRIDQGSLGGDGDLLLDGGVHRHFDLGVAADVDDDRRIRDGRVALELRLDFVRARAERGVAETPLAVGDLDLWPSRLPLQGDGHPGQRGALFIDDGAEEGAGLQLGEGGAAGHQEQHRGDG
jgi:hypothetical protein